MRALASIVVLAVVALSLGCASDPGLAGPPTGDAGAMRDAASATPDVNLPPGEPTYYGVVDDILAAHCWGCHSSAGGGIAPFVLDDYPSASVEAGAIAAATAARIMPPFFAVNDGTCRQFEDHGRWLSDADIATLGLWAAHGAPEGDPTTPPPMVMTPPRIDVPDATITMPTAFTPQPRGTDPNEIRCFVVDPNVASDQFITAYEVRPGTASVVHHVIVFEPETDADATSAMGMAGTDGRPGYACNGGPVVPAHPVALWAPGGHRTDYPAGTGLALPAHRALIMQIHYNMSAVGSTIPSDQTSVVFSTVATVARPALMTLLSQSSISLAPHDSHATTAPKTYTVPAAATVWGVFPHMHVTGRHLGVTLQHAGATSCALDVERWNFDWQQAYFYTTPISASRGDVVSIECQYDTSSRDATTVFGEGTENEMCLAFFYATVP